VLEPTPGMHIEHAAWLQANLNRPARTIAERREFGERHVHVPRQLLHCEDPEQCGSAIGFGAQSVDLIRVTETMGGDCWHRSCLLRDANTGRFATPPEASSWGAAATTKSGSCGIFLFDKDESRVLLESRLCVQNQGCEELGGTAIGWRVPGDRVGAPGAQ
jgi:hypothetical protein